MMPRIAIPVPTTGDLEYNRRSWGMYAACVERAGGEAVPVGLGLVRSEALRVAGGCAGVCLPGSPADVDPVAYGEERQEASAPADPARYAMDVLLLEQATAAGKPVLAICYGLQSLNVWRGGSLLQNLLPMPVNHAAGRDVAVAHLTLVARGSLLAEMVDAEEATEDGLFLRVPVNSSHHQAVASPGDGLRMAARCPDDGVVEAVEADPGDHAFAHGWVVGVQWHPERSYEISATSRALFAALVEEARLWAEKIEARD